MNKEPQPTTHNAEHRAHGTCREGSETGSFPQRIELNVCCSLIGEISWRFLEKSSLIWRNTWRNTLVIWRKHVRRFGENVFGDLEKTYSAIWRKHVRRKCWRFGETWSAQLWRFCFGFHHGVAQSPTTVSGDLNRNGEKMETNYGDQNFIHHKVESTYLGAF